jgi:hypothetical protein
VKSRLPTDRPAKAGTLSARLPALTGLTVVCFLAHAAVLCGLPRPHEHPTQDLAQHIAVRLTHLSLANPDTPTRDVAANQRTTFDAVPAAAPVPMGSTVQVGSARATPSAPREPAQLAPPPAADTAMQHLPTSALDLPPMPRSAPDEQYVEYVHRSGLPIQVRLFIDATGSVTETSLIGAAPGDEEAAEQVMAMFRETAFTPGRLQGREVASFIDIELVLEPTLPALGRIVRQ